MSDDNRAQYSVVEFFRDGTHAYVEPRWSPPKEAVELSKRLVDRDDPFVEKIIITDGGDNTVFQWERGKGVTFPVRAA